MIHNDVETAFPVQIHIEYHKLHKYKIFPLFLYPKIMWLSDEIHLTSGPACVKTKLVSSVSPRSAKPGVKLWSFRGQSAVAVVVV